MSALTKNERDGLNDVFMSIQTHSNRYEKMKEIKSFIVSHNLSFNIINLLKVAKDGLKETKISQYILNFTKKKK